MVLITHLPPMACDKNGKRVDTHFVATRFFRLHFTQREVTDESSLMVGEHDRSNLCHRGLARQLVISCKQDAELESESQSDHHISHHNGILHSAGPEQGCTTPQARLLCRPRTSRNTPATCLASLTAWLSTPFRKAGL
jgi:hypothetical protein